MKPCASRLFEFTALAGREAGIAVPLWCQIADAQLGLVLCDQRDAPAAAFDLGACSVCKRCDATRAEKRKGLAQARRRTQEARPAGEHRG